MQDIILGIKPNDLSRFTNQLHILVPSSKIFCVDAFCEKSNMRILCCSMYLKEPVIICPGGGRVVQVA